MSDNINVEVIKTLVDELTKTLKGMVDKIDEIQVAIKRIEMFVSENRKPDESPMDYEEDDLEKEIGEYYSVESVKTDDYMRSVLTLATVIVYSAEHNAYWRPNQCGYTHDRCKAGRYPFKEIWESVSSCDASKKLMLIPVAGRTGPL